MSKEVKTYFKQFAPLLNNSGKLNPMNFPILVSYCKNLANLDKVYTALDEVNQSLLQENITYMSGGQEVKGYRESAYAKMARDLSMLILRQAKQLGIDEIAGDKESDEMEKMLD
jgi:hypothetical protein